YLDQVEADMVQRLDIFKPREETAAPSATPPTGPGEEDLFVRYRVNELVDNTMCVGAPVIIEYSPTYYNLFGHIDYQARIGTLTTNLTMIKPGAIHRANGGYLVLQARDLLTSPLSWDALKRSLRGREVRIENIGEQYNPLPSATLRPQAIPVNTKIVLVGGTDLLRLLQTLDEDFRRYFKVTADFDTVMDRTPENMSKYAAFVAARCLESGLRPFHKMAVARIIEYSGRLVEDQERLTTRFMDIADIITEFDFWAGKEDGAPVMGDHVNKAIEQRRYRASLTDERLQELIENGTIHIATEGKAIGQVNGLAVYSVGDYGFGKPSRITARVSLGRGQVINVERETRMSGRIHDKGFMILTGYLKGEYGRDKPLSLSASIGFEQTYGEVDGDSASSTELYSLLSAISGLPID
ncbi:MAG: ATP-binding protein, partial [SAR202 cluster bacterium]|nr:ATP-binding protein [SAR202 cluster bacterium]